MKKLIVEFIENNIARCETDCGSFVDIELKSLPQNVKAGDIVFFDNNNVYINNKITDAEKEKMLKLQQKLKAKNN